MIELQSNTSEAIEKLKSTLDKLSSSDLVLRKAAFDNLADIKERIQQRGEKTDGSQIGRYSTGSDAKFSKSILDSGSKKAKSKAKKISVLDGDNISFLKGYAAFRKSLGRQINYIDLTLTGDTLDRGFDIIPIDDKSIGIGFLDNESAKKARFNEQRFGEIFSASDQEQQNFFQTVELEVNNVLENA